MSGWRDEARDLLPRIDAFFHDVLIADGRTGVEIIDGADDWLGLSGPLMGSMLPGGGPGRAGMIVDDGRIRRTFAHATDEELSLCRLGIVLHEAVHCIQFGRSAVEEGHPLDSWLAVALSDAIRRGALPSPVSSIPSKPWEGHGADFHRLLLHVFRRANHAGARARVTWLFAFEKYGLSRGCDYLAAIGSEPEALAHLSLFDVAAVAPPAAFVELWRRDTGEELERN